jgi:hypothetical protein
MEASPPMRRRISCRRLVFMYRSVLPEPPEMLILTPEAYKATEAVEFIAEHLRNEDEYTQVSYLISAFCIIVYCTQLV